jgi:hypothetical protein
VEDISLTWSLWGEFFSKKNDHIKGHVITYEKFYNEIIHSSNIANSCGINDIDYNCNNNYYIDKPVFILPLITFHVGHILIDVIEQLYNTMIDSYVS